MPRANQDRYNPLSRIPRTLFQHAHRDGNAEFPPNVGFNQTAEIFVKLPTNWNGTDDIVLWFLGAATYTRAVDVTIDVGTCDELFNTHTQTVVDIAISLVNNEYECLSLAVTHATVIALMSGCDMLWFKVVEQEDATFYLIGAEITET